MLTGRAVKEKYPGTYITVISIKPPHPEKPLREVLSIGLCALWYPGTGCLLQRLPLTFPETVLSLNQGYPRGVVYENISRNLCRICKAYKALSLPAVIPEKRNGKPAMVPGAGFSVGEVKGYVG